MEEERFDAVLTDIRMPDLDGRALYREIERRWPERARLVIFVSGDTLTSTLREFAGESGSPVIEKPFLPSEVRRVVSEAVAGFERDRRSGFGTHVASTGAQDRYARAG
jgi:CheY-like chemotaxis protein